LWKDSWELIKENPVFGVGTGDIKDKLKQKYTDERFFYGAENRFNPHNQFLHTGVALGFMGFIILVLLLTVPAAWAGKDKNYLFVSLCVIIAFNCMTESVLEVQKGVLFFSLFGLLLFNSKRE
jgi:O-antigen ligase